MPNSLANASLQSRMRPGAPCQLPLRGARHTRTIKGRNVKRHTRRVEERAVINGAIVAVQSHQVVDFSRLKAGACVSAGRHAVKSGRRPAPLRGLYRAG
jgi:hypothetical protein